jgi:large subunit ribosomal protein L28
VVFVDNMCISFLQYREGCLSLVSNQNLHIHFATDMARRDDISGVTPLNGFNSSKANNKTKRKFYPNLQKRKFYIPEEDRWVELKVTAKTLRTINKNGISATIAKSRAAGLLKKDI